ncbi:MAG: MOSC N-terminal beta barrel domain-containing protein [Aliishimia sp.]
MSQIAQLWRYPIKGLGAESLKDIEVSPERPFPLDRAWAVLENGGDTSSGWRPCRNFLRGAKGPSLMALKARTEGETIHFSHPDRPDFAFTPGNQKTEDVFFDWLAPIYPAERKQPMEVVESPKEGMADVSFASVSIMNLSSLQAVSQKAGQLMDVRRFRGNIWLEDIDPWAEFDLIGKTLSIGEVRLEVVEPITRCRATEANPATGLRDVSTLQLLKEHFGHSEFGVNARVKVSGRMAIADKVTQL